MSHINMHFFLILYFSLILLIFVRMGITNEYSLKNKTIENHIGKDELLNNFSSLLIDGKPTNNFNELFKKTVITDKETNAMRSDKIYFDMKCKCADLIFILLESINVSLSSNGNGEDTTLYTQKRSNENIAVSLLKKLNKRITSTLNTLFMYSDIAVNTKTSEPYFLKFLLLLYIYINSLENVKNQYDPIVNAEIGINDEVTISANEDLMYKSDSNQHEIPSGKETISYTSESSNTVSGNIVDEATYKELKTPQDHDQGIVLEVDEIPEIHASNNIESNDDVNIDVNEDNSENGPVKISEGKKMHRIILQIMNLIQRFTIENCHSNNTNTNDFNTIKNEKGDDKVDQKNENITDSDIKEYNDSNSFTKNHDDNNDTQNIKIQSEDKIKNDFDKELKNLDYFLEQIAISPDTYASQIMINIDDILLKRCVKGSAENENSNFVKICNKLLSVSRIKIQIENKIIKKSFDDFLKLVEEYYEIELIYDYLESIFQVIMKIIYQKSIETLNRLEILNFEYCKQIVSQLQSMNCPIDLIAHFNMLLNVIEFKENANNDRKIFDNVIENINKLNLENISKYIDSSIENEIKTSDLSLQNIMDTLLGVPFKQYWWIFNLLRTESEKKSYYVYDSSLNLFPKNVFFKSKYEEKQYTYKCNALTNMYNNVLHIKSMHNGCLPIENINKLRVITDYFKKISNHSSLFVSYLLKVLEKWDVTPHLINDVDLLDIFITTIIHLQNKYNTKILTYGPNFENRMITINKFLISKQNKLKQIGDFVLNLLDNYQYRHCNNLKSQHDIHKNKCNNFCIVPLDIVNISEIEKEHIIIDKSSKQITSKDPLKVSSVADENYGNNNMISNNKIDEKNKVQVKSIASYKSFKQVPGTFYNMPQLLTGTMTPEFKEIFGTNIYFNWYGKSKNIHLIQVDVLFNTLNMYELVDYQNVYLKWLVVSMLATWTEVILSILKTSSNVNKSTDITAVFGLLTEIIEYIIDFELDEKYFNILYLYLNLFNNVSNFESDMAKIDMLYKTFLNPVYKTLGVVKVNNPDLEKIASIFKIDISNGMISVCQHVIAIIKSYTSQIKDYFIFVDKTNKSLQYQKRLEAIFFQI